MLEKREKRHEKVAPRKVAQYDKVVSATATAHPLDHRPFPLLQSEVDVAQVYPLRLRPPVLPQVKPDGDPFQAQESEPEL